MSEIKVFDMKGSSVGSVEVDDAILEVKRGSQAVHDVVVAYMAGLRRGTASTLRKGEVAGSNKKPWRQKGTGRARAGLRQSPVWRGGGVAFGPHPRSFEKKINRKVAALAFRRAFSDKVATGGVRIVDQVVIKEPSTKVFAGMLKTLGIKGTVIFVVDKIGQNLVLSARNIPGVEITDARNLSVYQLLRYTDVIVDKAGMDQIKLRLRKEDSKAA